MRRIEYIVKDNAGIHAVPASRLTARASEYKSNITIDTNGKKTDVKNIMALLALGVRCGDKVIFLIEGEDEERAAKELKAFCDKNI